MRDEAGEVAETPASRARGRYTALFAIALILGGILIEALRELSYARGSLWPILLSLLIAIFLVGFVLVSIGITLFMRRWKTALSVILAPFITYAAFASAQALGITTTSVRFSLTKPYYEAQVGQASARGEEHPLLMAFHWGESGGAAMTNVFGRLIYDESEEIIKPAHQRSSRWRNRAETNRNYPLYGIADPDPDPRWTRDVQNLGGHFYLLTETY